MKLFGTVYVTSEEQKILEDCLLRYDELRDYQISKTEIPKNTAISKKLTINVKGEQDGALLDSILKNDLNNRIHVTTKFEVIAEKLLTEFIRFVKDRTFHYLSIWLATIGAIYLAFYSSGIGHIWELEWYVHIEIILFSFIPAGAELLNQFNHFRIGRINNNT